MPPVFGKEIRNGSSMADTSSAGIGHFVLIISLGSPFRKGGAGGFEIGNWLEFGICHSR
jgi:hypothetical protein